MFVKTPVNTELGTMKVSWPQYHQQYLLRQTAESCAKTACTALVRFDDCAKTIVYNDCKHKHHCKGNNTAVEIYLSTKCKNVHVKMSQVPLNKHAV